MSKILLFKVDPVIRWIFLIEFFSGTRNKSRTRFLQLQKLLAMACFCVILHPSFAQDLKVSGRVSSLTDGSPLPGVNVIVKGTSQGTVTDANGNYSLAVQSLNSTLVFSFIGLRSEEVVLTGQTTVDLQMTEDVTQLGEVVVTAQGIERDQRSLGYSLQSVKGTDVTQRSEPNLLNSLQGKLAGVNIVGSSGAPGASTNINIRGITSFNGSNQPLIVVDGVIFSNQTNNTSNTLFDSQTSNRLQDINPDIIESINILKGPAAAVLYGSRASAGAIIITTKSGRSAAGTEVTFSSSYNAQQVYGLPKFQNEYGQGVNNDFVNTSTNSWGPRFGEGLTEVVTLQGETVPYQAYPNNVKDFYKTGGILQNTLSVASGSGDNNFVFSIGNLDQKGIIPNTAFKRTNVNIGANTKLANGLKVGGSLNYANTKQNGTILGNGGSATGNISRIPRSYDLMGRPFEDVNGKSIYFSSTTNHPMWSTKYETQESQVNRFFGHVTLGYDITKWLSATYRLAGDVFTDSRQNNWAIGSARQPQGLIIIDEYNRTEFNGDLMLTATKQNILMDGLHATLLVGNNINQRAFFNPSLAASSLTIPGFYDPSNASTVTYNTLTTRQKQRLVGYYGQLSLNYKDFAFIEFTGRADQSSTLPKSSNTYFYPGVNVSFVPTDAFGLSSNILSYIKIKGNIARVGRDATPYQLNSVFVSGTYGNNVASVSFPLQVSTGNIPGFGPSTRIGSNTLTPEFVTSSEVGINVGLFQNRLGIDANYFNTVSSNQIFNVAISNSSGYSTRTTNIGEMVNKGLEVVLSATVVKAGDFKWDMNINFTRIRNTVKEISPGVDNAAITGNAFTGLIPSIKTGYPYGVIISTKLARNPEGELLVNPVTGQYVPGIPNQVIANPQPDWLAGVNNNFSFKGINLSVLFDTRQGGDIFSFPVGDLRGNGSLAMTAVDRGAPRILPGVIANADGTYRPNNIQISAQTYWGALGGLVGESNAFDATVYRLREMSLSYSLPKTLLSKTPFGQASIGVSGRNLWFYAPHFLADPELNTQGAGNIQGLDLNGPPNVRNFGANLRLTF